MKFVLTPEQALAKAIHRIEQLASMTNHLAGERKVRVEDWVDDLREVLKAKALTALNKGR
jgi:hypothetical protein